MYLYTMQFRKSLLLLLLTCLLISGCGIFRKKCDCPRFSNTEQGLNRA